MRPVCTLLLSLMALAPALALDGPERGLAERLNYRPPMIGEKITKENQAWTNPLASKKFEGGNGMDLKKKSTDEKSTFATKDFTSEKFQTRSFLGIKNPWFGNKVYDTKSDYWAKEASQEKDKKFAVDEARMKSFEQGKKEAVLNGSTIETKTFTERGRAQGALKDDQRENLTIDDVREILNKNR